MLYVYIFYFKNAVQLAWVLKRVIVCLSCIWLYWCFLAFYGWCGFFTHENPATLLLNRLHFRT